MKGSKLKMYKSLELRMFWVHFNSVEPKVQHVYCSIVVTKYIFIKIFNVLIMFLTLLIANIVNYLHLSIVIHYKTVCNNVLSVIYSFNST